ncbi:A/G-specific adenine glycosylase [Candidatus Legionella polyplacis]|uniref:A/G-specific adenine glycosylase n=1 Tax=Candidatus Legionella polyplacis TaxID=2005262 RepID=UPI000C1E5884|nr:A/G-specific adenine glycosylase [Candidatus Legionella polyplacis]ATW01721.1 A/G-specific adenine glycosylase [Candidatus Legionella polyplacis]
MKNIEETFTKPLLKWFDKYGRKNLPWKNSINPDPYKIWISEIMLQQTRLKTVIPYYNRFINKFPNIQYLAEASEEEILLHWSGLGYYNRAINLIKTSKIIWNKYNGNFPNQIKFLIKLPGIGPSTAAAIISQAFNLPKAILDTNAKRVLYRYFNLSYIDNQKHLNIKLINLANKCVSKKRSADYTQAIMDLGFFHCKSRYPNCITCPLHINCISKKNKIIPPLSYKNRNKKNITKCKKFLLIYNSYNEIFLIKQSYKKLWPKLWTIPYIDFKISIKEYIENKYNLNNIKNIYLLTKFKYPISNFILNVKSIAIQIESNHTFINKKSNIKKWLKINKLNKIGLSKISIKIIDYFKTYTKQ